MAIRKMKNPKDEDIKAFLGKGAEFEGKLVLTGSVRIEGDFKGEVLGKGTLIVGEGSHVTADIAVDNILIFGEVRGNLTIMEKTEISSTGRLFGELITSTLVVHEGAKYEGECKMEGKEDKNTA
jgi:cytoskeletal protein CcmA (bactofilin family)